MGLFSKTECAICGEEAGVFTGIKLDNGESICGNCIAKVNISDGYSYDVLRSSSINEIKKRMKYVDNDLKENENRISQFRPTTKVDNYIWFDDEHKWFAFPTGFFSNTIDKSYAFKYDEILDYELLEDGTSITKGGFGKAIVGGAVFGIAGAIAGGTSKKTKQVCTNMQIKITTRNTDRPIMYINLIGQGTEYKKDSLVYKGATKSAQTILSKFQIIINELENKKEINNENKNNDSFSVADELKKLKELLDMEVITQEEFNKMKEQLLVK